MLTGIQRVMWFSWISSERALSPRRLGERQAGIAVVWEREHQATGTLVILATPDLSWICHTLDPLLDGGIVPEEDNLWQVRDKSNR